MADIVSQRQTFILVADDNALFPAKNLYPADDLYPKDAGLLEITNIVLGSLKLDEKIAENIPQFGQIFADRFECKVYLVDDIKGKFIQVYQLDGNMFIPVFTGFIDSCKLDKVGTDRTIVAYDFAYTKGKINVAPWWTEFWQNRETATLKQARDSMLDWADIAYEDVILPNDSIEITKTVDISTCTLTVMLKMMCELSYCFPHFNRIGELQFIFLNTDPDEIKDLTGEYEWTKSSFEDFITTDIDGVQFYDSGNQLKWTIGNTGNAYPIRKNIFLYEKSTNLLNQIGNEIFEYLQDLAYTPAKVNMIVSDWELGLGDYVHTEKGDFYVLHNSYGGAQFFEQSIEAKGQQILYGGTPHIDYGELILNEKIARVNFAIEQFQIEYGDFKNQTNSKFTQTAEAISTEVTRASQAEGNLSSRITQNAESITSEVTRATTKETTITTNLNNEVTRATNAEGALSTRITTETTNLSSRITQTAEAITSEVTRATEVEESMFANYIGTVVPTTSNAPASSWNTDAKKAAHVGETYYNKTTKKYYRWTATKSGSTVTYNWQAIDTTTARSYSVVSSTIKQTADSLTSEITAETSRATGEESNLSSRITQTADAISSEVTRATSAEGSLSSRITQNANSISSEVSRASAAEGALDSKITQTAESISLDVSNGETSSTIVLKLGETQLSSKTIQMTGLVTFSNLSSDGQTTINGSNITTGTIDASRVSVTNLNADNITSGTISADRIQGGQLTISTQYGHTDAIVVKVGNSDYITMNESDGLIVGKSYGWYKTTITGSGINVGDGKVTIDGNVGSGAIVVGSSTSSQIRMKDGQLTIKNNSFSDGAINISSNYKGIVISGGSTSNAIEVSQGNTSVQGFSCTSLSINRDSYSSGTISMITGSSASFTPSFSEIKDVDLNGSNLWAVDSYSAPTMKGNYSDGYNFSSSPNWKKIELSKSSYSTKIYGITGGSSVSSPTFTTKTVLVKN